MSDYIRILGIKINKVDMGQAISEVERYIRSDGKKYIVTANSEMLVMAQEDKDLARIINKSDLSVADGAGVVLASKLSRNSEEKLPERVAGFDILQNLLKLSSEKRYSIYLLGSKPGIIDIAAEKIRGIYPEIKIVGKHHGYLDNLNREELIKKINSLEPDILFVGMGVPLQEKFIYSNLDRLKVKVAMVVGGSFDVMAGQMKRAPLWMQNLNLEWLYRLIQEPSRAGRMMALPRFAYLVIKDKFLGDKT
ncbi:MAG: WecB/TagA/CpsF family glycosyltransferase [Halanaerobiales bacterium]